MTRAESERNAAIWAAYVSGRTELDIGTEHGISQQRVSQIIQTFKDAIPQPTREELARREIAFLDHVRSEAMYVAKLPAPPVTAGKDGDLVYDPTHKGPDGKPAVVRDHGGRLAAMSLAVQTSAHLRKLVGLDAPTRTEITGGVRHEVVGVDPEDLT